MQRVGVAGAEGRPSWARYKHTLRARVSDAQMASLWQWSERAGVPGNLSAGLRLALDIATERNQPGEGTQKQGA